MKKVFTIIFTLMLVLSMFCPFVYADTGDSVMTLYNSAIQNIVVILGVLGALAFALELIVQLTKELPGIKRIPTKLYVIIVSIVVSVLSLFIYTSYAGITVLWYYIVLSVFAAFVAAYISIYGWDTLKELYTRVGKGEAEK